MAQDSLKPSHPASAYSGDVQTVLLQSRLVVTALILNIGVRVYQIGVRAWQDALIARNHLDPGDVSSAALAQSDSLILGGTIIHLVLFVTTAVLFLRWLAALTRTAKSLGAIVPWSASDAVVGFFIPIVSFTRPYEVIKTVHDALSTELLPIGTSEVIVATGSAYRSGHRGGSVPEPFVAAEVPHALIGAWWLTFWLARISGNLIQGRNFTWFGSAAEVVAALLAIVVVRGLSGRLSEWNDGINQCSVEELAKVAITF